MVVVMIVVVVVVVMIKVLAEIHMVVVMMVVHNDLSITGRQRTNPLWRSSGPNLASASASGN